LTKNVIKLVGREVNF